MTDTITPITTLTAQIAAAYLTANVTPTGAVPGLIRDIHDALSDPKASHSENAPRDLAPTASPAAAFQKSVFHDHLVCLEDGLSMTMLKRHLISEHGLTPEEYRIKWGLPDNYPMVAPDYTKIRSQLAKASGLGRNR